MNLFDVYPLFDIEPVSGEGSYIFDTEGNKYLDLYGGHAVISIGHSHPHYVEQMSHQLNLMGFYSNSVKNRLQNKLANLLGQQSGYQDYQLFLCNSGAEANENALKLASFINGRDTLIAFENGFHGRTSAAVAVTDNAKIQAPINKSHKVRILGWNDIQQFEKVISEKKTAAVIIEGIQGIGGIHIPRADFLLEVSRLCKENGTILILDEIQSGYGRSGKFFAHQYTSIQPDIITVAKGMGNGFPIGGVLIHPEIKSSYGLLGTTFGGNHLACVAAICVLEVIEKEGLIKNASQLGTWWKDRLNQIEGIKIVRGEGLMIALEFDFPVKDLRSSLLYEHKIFTGSAKDPNTIRLLPPLNVSRQELESFNTTLETLLAEKHELK